MHKKTILIDICNKAKEENKHIILYTDLVKDDQTHAAFSDYYVQKNPDNAEEGYYLLWNEYNFLDYGVDIISHRDEDGIYAQSFIFYEHITGIGRYILDKPE